MPETEKTPRQKVLALSALTAVAVVIFLLRFGPKRKASQPGPPAPDLAELNLPVIQEDMLTSRPFRPETEYLPLTRDIFSGEPPPLSPQPAPQQETPPAPAPEPPPVTTPIAYPASTTGLSERPKELPHRLKAILRTEDDTIAHIDSLFVKVGDRVGTHTVTHIDRHDVVLTSEEGKEFTLHLSK